MDARQIVNQIGSMDAKPFKVLLKIVHDTFKRKNANNLPLMRMSSLNDDYPAENIKINVNCTIDDEMSEEKPQEITVELSGETRRKINFFVDLKIEKKRREKIEAIDAEKQKISQIIYELIMQKYLKRLEDIKNRLDKKLKTLEIFQCDRKNCIKSEEKTDEGNTDICNNPLEESVENFEKSVENPTENYYKSSENVEQSVDENYHKPPEETVEYDPELFLEQALGKDNLSDSTYYYSAPDISINSSNVSTLISSFDPNSLYSSIQKSPITTIYESMEDFEDHNEEILKKIIEEWTIINQVSNALKTYRKRPKKYNEGIMVEAEKILLISTLKRDFYKSKQDDISYLPQDKTVTIDCKMHNLKFYLKQPTSIRYYLCILTTSTQIITSKTLNVEEQEAVIEFKDVFSWQGTGEMTQFTVAVYGLVTNLKITNKFLSKQMSFMPQEPSFLKQAEAKINLLCESSSTTHALALKSNKIFKPNFNAVIDYKITINVFEQGFLNVSNLYNRCPLWNKRWCQLNGVNLTCWNHPNEVDITDPIVDINLSNCVKVGIVEREFCSRVRTMELVFKNGDKILLNADNRREFNQWKRQLEIVLDCLKKF